MRTDKQALDHYRTERAALRTKQTELEQRLAALDSVIGGLEGLTGEKRTLRGGRTASQATGTKALIIDALADGKPVTALVLAESCKVTPSAIRLHLNALIESGDVQRRGRGRSTTYVVP